jgi:hypothetical protein
MKILNLTQHAATLEQIADGVVDLPEDARKKLSALLTFDELPSTDELIFRAEELADFAAKAIQDHNCSDQVMIGGAPFFMGFLEVELFTRGLQPVYAFSKRVVEEVTKEDGTVEKKAVFKHLGFVEV